MATEATGVLRARNDILTTARGVVTENFALAPGNNFTQIMVDGTAYFTAVGLRGGDVVTRIVVLVATAGAGMTLSKVGIYNSAGVQLGVSADQGTAWQSTGYKEVALTTPYTATTDGGYYLAVIAKATLPTLARGAMSNLSSPALTGGMALYGVQTGQTNLPAPATIDGANAGVVNYWAGAE